MTLRRDIQGLRAISVIAVILFHMGYFKLGYLGVDIFFVISGYLISGGLLRRKTNYIDFVKRRIKRILPLSLTVTAVCVPVAYYLMLPDDLENFSASAFATVMLSNNVLQLITTRDYWDVVNEYKPLLHTWSLGVEEQYYLFFPLVFLFTKRTSRRWKIIATLSIFSFILFIIDTDPARNFYWLPSRIFEFGLGALYSFKLEKNVKNRLTLFVGILFISSIILNAVFYNALDSSKAWLLVSVFLAILTIEYGFMGLKFFLSLSPFVWLGNISYSLYMWHQPILAFGRYSFFDKLDALSALTLASLTLIMSVISYYLVEENFRRGVVKFKSVLGFVLVLMIAVSISSLYIYSRNGIVRDYSILGLQKTDVISGHNEYNHRVYQWSTFSNEYKRTKILCIGNSYARDFANVLREYDTEQKLDIVYIYDDQNSVVDKNRTLMNEAEVVFWTELSPGRIETLENYISKTFIVGPKQFGNSSGRVYFKNRYASITNTRALVSDEILGLEEELSLFWEGRYFSLLDVLMNEKEEVRTLTDDSKLISQDSRHLTKFGAEYLAEVLKHKLDIKLNNEPNHTKP